MIIVVHQLPDLFGLPADERIDRAPRHRTWSSHLGDTNGWTLGIGAAVFAIVVAAERDRPQASRRAASGWSARPSLVAALGLHAHGVAVLGTLAHGAPRLGLFGLSWSALGSVAPIAGVVALVIVSQSAATTRAFADQGHYEVDVGRDFVGVGRREHRRRASSGPSR